MILDTRLELSDKQAVTTTATSANTIDFGQKSPDLGGAPTPLYAVFTVNETFAGLTSLALQVQHSDTENSGFAVLLAWAAIPLAELKAGKQVVIPMPMQHKRFVRFSYNVNGTATAGKVSLHIVSGLQLNEPQPDSPRAWGGK